ncbi:MAG: DJ-1/PfpI family protein [Desulfobacteraceae bacterium]|jgi:4-methyl-5(b-hydroxyethyl)-thiazole monophosphate biosynthesis
MTVDVLVPIAEGSEEIEAVTIIDVLRRAEAQVTVASVDTLQITASRGVNIVADCLIEQCKGRDFDLIALPGGIPGAENLRDNPVLKEILLRQQTAGRLYGAICAAPAVVLQAHGLLENRRATCHPSFVEGLQDRSSVASRVVVDGNCITSRGPGTALAFSLKLVEMLFGKDKMEAVAAPMVIA